MRYEDVLDRVHDAAVGLVDPEAAEVRRVVEIVRGHSLGSSDAPIRELNRLSETLARRGARALPAAALARAVLADLWQDDAERERALVDCDAKLQLFGL